MAHPCSKANLNTYTKAQGLAYDVLNRVEKKLRHTKATELVQLIQYEWHEMPDFAAYQFRVRVNNQTIVVAAPDTGALEQMNWLQDEWAAEAADEIVAWLLLMEKVA